MQICNQCNYTNGNDATFCNRCGGHLKGIQNPLIDRIIDKYRITERIGGGGFGTVYQAHHIELNNPFAIKLLHPHLLHNEEMVERFRREARLLAGLRHENIVQVIDFGSIDGLGFYLVMEWLSGKTLQWHIKEEGLPPFPIFFQIFEQLLDALDHAHSNGVVHRDLKPENLVLLKGNRNRRTLKILDFGIARMVNDPSGRRITETGLAVGTPRYMAPEQAAGEIDRVDHRADIYSVGVLLVELLTGRQLFGGTTNEVLLHQIETPAPRLSELVPTRSFPPALEWVIQRALAKDPEKRFSSAREFADSLLSILEQESAQLYPSASNVQLNASNSALIGYNSGALYPASSTPSSESRAAFSTQPPPTLGLPPLAETRALPLQGPPSIPHPSGQQISPSLSAQQAAPLAPGQHALAHSSVHPELEKQNSAEPRIHYSFWIAATALSGLGLALLFWILQSDENHPQNSLHSSRNVSSKVSRRLPQALPSLPKRIPVRKVSIRPASSRILPLPNVRSSTLRSARALPLRRMIRPAMRTSLRTPVRFRVKVRKKRIVRRRVYRRKNTRRADQKVPIRTSRNSLIWIRSIPSRAKVSVDSVHRGRTPIQVSCTPGQKLQIRMEKEGFFLKKSTLTVGSKKSYTVRLVKDIFSR